MRKELFLAVILAGLLALSAGAAGFYAGRAHPARPAIAAVPDFGDTVATISLENFDGRQLRGHFAGDQPRFLLGAKKTVVVPASDGSFVLDLRQIR